MSRFKLSVSDQLEVQWLNNATTFSETLYPQDILAPEKPEIRIITKEEAEELVNNPDGRRRLVYAQQLTADGSVKCRTLLTSRMLHIRDLANAQALEDKNPKPKPIKQPKPKKEKKTMTHESPTDAQTKSTPVTPGQPSTEPTEPKVSKKKPYDERVRGMSHKKLGTCIITKINENNPRRAGTGAAKQWELYKDGQTVAEFIAAGGNIHTVKLDFSNGHIDLSNPIEVGADLSTKKEDETTAGEEVAQAGSAQA